MLFQQWLEKLKKVNFFINTLKTMDPGLYFPFFIVFTAPFVFYFWGIVKTYLFIFCLSFFHFLFLKVNPYIKESNYYNYLALKEQFFLSHEKYKLPFLESHVSLAKIFLLFSFYGLFILPEFLIAFSPWQILAFILVFSNTTIEILNIVSRPQLSEKIKWFHPILQQRYSPVVDLIINKIVPLCGKLVGGLGSSYVIFGPGYKAFHGIDAIDPIRQYILTRYHAFPAGFEWDEPTVIAWRRFNATISAQEINPEDRISIFIQKNKEFSETVEKFSKEMITKNLPKNK